MRADPGRLPRAVTRGARVFSHVIGVDDAPFPREAPRGDAGPRASRRDVRIFGAAFSGPRLTGILSGRVRRDGRNATSAIDQLVRGSQFFAQLHLVMLQGIALAGFNVVDIAALAEGLGTPVLVVARRQPRMDAIRAALLTRVPGGARKWALIEKAGPMEPAGGVFVQRAGISLADADAVIRAFAQNGNIPEPLRVAHLVAGGVTTGKSRGRT